MAAALVVAVPPAGSRIKKKALHDKCGALFLSYYHYLSCRVFPDFYKIDTCGLYCELVCIHSACGLYFKASFCSIIERYFG